jgi:uncharacterized membrane protein YdbT with pleckstrin-like domain
MNYRKHPGEKILLKTRPRFISALESALIRFVILLLLLYFFTTIIAIFAMIKSNISSLTTVPFVEWSTDVLILVIAILFFWILWSVLSWRSICYTLTSQRVIIKSGVIRTKNVYMHYNKMQDMVVSQGLIQRISSAGDIEIFGGRDRTNLILENIPNPDKVENLINQRIEEENQEYETRSRNPKPRDEY